MKITKVEVKKITLPLKEKFKIALGEEEEYKGVIVKIKTDENIIGIGEASPSEKITGEEWEGVVKVIENVFTPILLGKNPLMVGELMEEIDSSILHNSSAKCAIDIALHDIWGKYVGVPLKNLLGGGGEVVETSVTIGIKPLTQTLSHAQSLVTAGVKRLKLKLGTNPEEDVEKVAKLREKLGYNFKLTVDANQGYTYIDAFYVLQKISPFCIEFIEQPLPFWDIEGLKELKNSSPIPLMVDESLHSFHDATRLIKERVAHLFNIKLMKAGGIFLAHKIVELAQKNNIPCMIGSMVETKIGITAGTHLAVSEKNVKYTDLDGHLFLAKDITKGGVTTLKGKNYLKEKEGLGIELLKWVEF